MLLHVVKETDAGIIVRGAKYETAAAYANQAFIKPTIANWGDEKLSDYAVGFICDLCVAEPEAHLPHRLRRPRAGRGLSAVQPVRRGRLRSSIFDNVLIPWENVLFYRHTRGGHVHPRRRCTAIRPSPSCSAPSRSPT